MKLNLEGLLLVSDQSCVFLVSVKRRSPEPKKSELGISSKLARLDDERINKEPDLEPEPRHASFSKFSHGVNEGEFSQTLS